MPEARLTRTRAAYVPDAQARREDEERAERNRAQDQHGKVLASPEFGDFAFYRDGYNSLAHGALMLPAWVSPWAALDMDEQ